MRILRVRNDRARKFSSRNLYAMNLLSPSIKDRYPHANEIYGGDAAVKCHVLYVKCAANWRSCHFSVRRRNAANVRTMCILRSTLYDVVNERRMSASTRYEKSVTREFCQIERISNVPIHTCGFTSETHVREQAPVASSIAIAFPVARYSLDHNSRTIHGQRGKQQKAY